GLGLRRRATAPDGADAHRDGRGEGGGAPGEERCGIATGRGEDGGEGVTSSGLPDGEGNGRDAPSRGSALRLQYQLADSEGGERDDAGEGRAGARAGNSKHRPNRIEGGKGHHRNLHQKDEAK